jgi:hypothetical protein
MASRITAHVNATTTNLNFPRMLSPAVSTAIPPLMLNLFCSCVPQHSTDEYQELLQTAETLRLVRGHVFNFALYYSALDIRARIKANYESRLVEQFVHHPFTQQSRRPDPSQFAHFPGFGSSNPSRTVADSCCIPLIVGREYSTSCGRVIRERLNFGSVLVQKWR